MERNKIDINEIKILYDADPMNIEDIFCNGKATCPDFALHEKSNTVKFIDKAHNIVDFTIPEYDEFVDRVKKGNINKIDYLLRGEKEYVVGHVRFLKGDNSDRVVVTSQNGDAANMSVKHFNVFVGAILEGKMKKVSEHKIKSSLF